MQTHREAEFSYLHRLDGAILRRLEGNTMTQQEIAESIGVSQPTVSRAIRRLTSTKRIRITERIAHQRQYYEVA